MLLAIVILIAAFVFLIKSANWLVDAAAKVGMLFGIPHLVIGLTVVAFGTSAPELAVSVSAVIGDHSGLVMGNVVGSNLINITLGIGVSVLFLTLTVCKSTLKELLIFMGSIALLFLLTAIGTFGVSRWEGIILLIGFLLFVSHIYLDMKRGRGNILNLQDRGDKDISPILTVGQLCLSIVGLAVSGHLVVEQCVYLGRLLNIAENIIGVTIVAMGTSLPDVTTSIVAAYKGNNDIAIGNIVGSNIFNVLLILGVSAVLSNNTISANGLEVDFLVMAVASIMLCLCALLCRRVGKMMGISLIAMYAAYMYWVVWNIL